MKHENHEGLSIAWLGHAAFRMEYRGLVVVTDPFPDDMGYPPIRTQADVVTISHEHFDHNHASSVRGHPRILRGLDAAGDWQAVDETLPGSVRIRALRSYHDGQRGRARGKNAIFVFDFGEMRVVHLGDLGHALDAGGDGSATAEALGTVHVLLLPVGGHYTIDAETAAGIARAVAPAVVVPMHYKTAATSSLPIEGIEAFTRRMRSVTRLSGAQTVGARALSPGGQPQVWVFADPGAGG